MPETDTSPLQILRPEEAVRRLRDSFRREVICVKGRLERVEKTYKSGFYHTLVGESGGTLTLLTPPALNARLPQTKGQVVTVRGYLDFTLSNDRIQPLLYLTEVLHAEAAPETDPRLPLLEKILRKDRQDVPTLLRRALLAGERPRLLLFYAREGIVDHDLEKALGQARAAYALEERRVSFQPEALREALERADREGFLAIGVVRGGGSGLEVFDQPALIETGLQLKTPLIAALGHARDDTLFSRLADWRLATPSLLGTALRDLAEERAQEPVPVPAAEPLQIEQMKRNLMLWQTVAGVLAALLLALLLWRLGG
jgi:exodeoxyribonuclease VII large subunit